jgi:hypothetical protein
MSIENICKKICQNKASTNYWSHHYLSFRFNLCFLLRRCHEVWKRSHRFFTSSPSKLNNLHIMVLLKNMPWMSTIFGYVIQTPEFNEWCSSTAALRACTYTNRCVSTQFFLVSDGLLCSLLLLFSYLSYTYPIKGINLSVSLLTHQGVLSGSSTLPLDWSGQ